MSNGVSMLPMRGTNQLKALPKGGTPFHSLAIRANLANAHRLLLEAKRFTALPIVHHLNRLERSADPVRVYPQPTLDRELEFQRENAFQRQVLQTT